MSASNDLHDDSTVTPAADAGPRQPVRNSRIANTECKPVFWVEENENAWSVMYRDADSPSGNAAITGGDKQLAIVRCRVLNDLIENERVQLRAAQEALVETLAAALDAHLQNAAPPVPQEAAPYDRDEVKRLEREIKLTGDNRFVGHELAATAPDWAMRAALEIVPSVHENYAFDDTLPEREAVYAHVAALIRQAGSEREWELENGLRQLIDHSRRYKNGWMGAGVLEEHLIAASRLLGGETK